MQLVFCTEINHPVRVLSTNCAPPPALSILASKNIFEFMKTLILRKANWKGKLERHTHTMQWCVGLPLIPVFCFVCGSEYVPFLTSVAFSESWKHLPCWRVLLPFIRFPWNKFAIQNFFLFVPQRNKCDCYLHISFWDSVSHVLRSIACQTVILLAKQG